MRPYFFLLLTSGLLLFSGCSPKQYFEPKQTHAISQIKSHYSGTIVHKSHHGATLDNGHYIDKKGISRITLEAGFHFLNENRKYILAGNKDGTLALIDKKRGKVKKRIELHEIVVSASIKNGLIAYILGNNTFGLYRLRDGKKLIENHAEHTYAIDSGMADPLFIDSIVVVPMLDGKLIIFDTDDTEAAKVIYLSGKKVFNNIIFLLRAGNTLVAATPKKLLALGTDKEFYHHANIAEVAVYRGHIYLFTKEGEIVKLNTKLKRLAKKKFRFAKFSAATVIGGTIYVLDMQGSLIVTDTKLKQSKVYDVGKVKSPVFISGNKLYKDGKIIRLDALGYK
ncbi:MAG: WD40 repeat domain-containing protein [Sulfurovum sp.]|nr:WD40 repeat domain-containing protein [Sulfurovum sp.]MCB4747971.1 WD40 repeat domain-containing protein [Sulfurovum sp.]MCB4749122.1 WD40 repeat domain-containing protein [Sulfurovum sp.]MCB4751849.1 WD40 repeat domain-containing protein [Sulfurovum sp.]MCB4753925.1 WD40 repeat domain-containing protein [Sulfurovum sp.]